MPSTPKHPKFSVLVSNYNYARYLPAAIASVLRQTVTDFEIVIVDDGSTDNSAATIAKLLKRDPRIRAVRQENSGQAVAFNRGFAESRGRFVCFLDADDLWRPEKLEWLDRVFTAQPEVGLVQHNLHIVRHSRWSQNLYRSDLMSGNVLPQIASRTNIDFFVPTSGIAARQAVLARVFPVPDALRICADAFVTRASLVHGPLFSINLPLAGYRLHDNNCWTGNPNRGNPNMVMDKIMPMLMDYYYRCGVRGVAKPGTVPAGNAPPKPAAPPAGNAPQKPAAPPAAAAPPAPPRINREAALVAQIVLMRLQHLKARFSRIAIYGAGAHTRWLFDLLIGTGVYPDRVPEVTTIMDDRAERCDPIAGIAIRSPAAVQPDEFDTVLLSSDCHQEPMRRQLRDRFGDAGFVVEDLYQGLPAGPYPKLTADEVNTLRQNAVPEAVRRENAIVFHLVVERLRLLKATCPRIALYGGGAHTRWLMELVAQGAAASPGFPQVTAIMDEHPERCEAIGRLSVLSPLQVPPRLFDAIVISSDCQQEAMRGRLSLIFCHSKTPIIDLYEGLPPGPYAKPDALAQQTLWREVPGTLRLATAVESEAPEDGGHAAVAPFVRLASRPVIRPDAPAQPARCA